MAELIAQMGLTACAVCSFDLTHLDEPEPDR
jgi:predicted HNH restriction endonuclease